MTPRITNPPSNASGFGTRFSPCWRRRIHAWSSTFARWATRLPSSTPTSMPSWPGSPQPRAASSRPNLSPRFPHPFGFDGFEAGSRRKPA